MLFRSADAFRKDSETAEKEVVRILGRPCKFGPTSKDLGAILFDEMKLAGGTRDKKGNWDVGNEALQALVTQRLAVWGVSIRGRQVRVWPKPAPSAAASWVRIRNHICR